MTEQAPDDEPVESDQSDATGADQEPPAEESIVETAKERPEQVDVEKVVALFDADNNHYRFLAKKTLFYVASDDPSRVEPYSDELVEALEDDYRIAAEWASVVLKQIGRESPEAVVPGIPGLIQLLKEDPPSRGHRAAKALATVLDHSPESFVEHTDDLIDALLERDDPSPYPDDPSELEEEEREQMVQTIAQRRKQIQADVQRALGVRELAAHALVEVAKEDPDTLAAEIDRLGPALSMRPPLARSAVLDAIGHVATDDPAAVEPVLDDVLAVLEDDAEPVQAHAVRTVGYAEATEAVEPLRDLAGDDEVDEELAGLAADTADWIEDAT